MASKQKGKLKPLVVKPMNTAEMLDWVKEYTRRFEIPVEMTAMWAGFARATHWFSHKGGDKFWHMNMCDETAVVETGKELRRRYADALWLACVAHVHRFLVKPGSLRQMKGKGKRPKKTAPR